MFHQVKLDPDVYLIIRTKNCCLATPSTLPLQQQMNEVLLVTYSSEMCLFSFCWRKTAGSCLVDFTMSTFDGEDSDIVSNLRTYSVQPHHGYLQQPPWFDIHVRAISLRSARPP
jgi:hypothetical protein